MQFTTITALFAAAGLAAAAPLEARATEATCPVTTQGDYVWKISNFYGRKPQGTYYNSLGFNIKATNGGTLDFTCSAQANKLEDGKFYSCGENSFMDFAFQSDRNGLLLRQKVSDKITYVATTTLPNYCRAGGNGPKDFVCQGVSDAYITLVQLPKA
ncbi:alt a 1 major allergen [Stemphylium lycopersici]|uniref:Alt a 1 major allergen n=1 Tax=Stemphylium lycopersici TaxID=183478 RepID=A0A364N9M0_STELY|nr:alt a 1 major allergen [Stemphylium lycopersici]RAQ99522.1 alt a 1 major allergen [Stemphylium lycopersici]RAR13966.1 alt a 1 major allergen [Stemphylium lycopersici]